jgi:hypothetical protein
MNCLHAKAKYTGRRSNGERACYLYIYDCPECGILFGSPAAPNTKGIYPGPLPLCAHTDVKPVRREERTCCNGKTKMLDIWGCPDCGAEFSL